MVSVLPLTGIVRVDSIVRAKSIRFAPPRAGDNASQLWAHSLEARELVDKLDAINQTALADLVLGFFGSDGQLLRIIDNQVTKWKGELLRLSS